MTVSTTPEIIYPDSDGQPMAENTEQFNWIVLLKENLECCFANDPAVFVAGDLLWYPVEGRPDIRIAPDAMVVFGRPKGKRGSYRQWQEGNIAPQVVFEVLSPGNTSSEMAQKLQFYQRYGVEEYYLYDPERNDWQGWQRQEVGLVPIREIADWQSPRLGIRFVLTPETLAVYYPDGQRFLQTIELRQAYELEREKANRALLRAEKLAAKLRELGLEPDL